MATILSNKLKLLVQSLPSNTPIGSQELNKLGISTDLVVYYTKSGWLKRIAHGVYTHPEAELELRPCVHFLEASMPGLHIGGKSALSLYGITHYLKFNETTVLYGWDSGKLPDWFSNKFKAVYKRKRLFNESLDNLLYVSKFDSKKIEAQVSEQERAFLEMLSEVGTSQTYQEAVEIMESAFTIRKEPLRKLLENCKSVKTVRLFIQIAKQVSLPISNDLDSWTLPKGSDSNWVRHSNNSTLVLKP